MIEIFSCKENFFAAKNLQIRIFSGILSTIPNEVNDDKVSLDFIKETDEFVNSASSNCFDSSRLTTFWVML